MKKKRIVVVSDFHSGSLVGLSPYGKNTKQYTSRLDKLEKARQQCWAFFASEIEKLKPIDICFANGDMIDGDGSRAGGTDQLVVDRLVQCEMAIEILKFIDAKDYVLTYGTPYHTGTEEDYENIVAQRIGGKIGSHEWVDVNGVVFDLRHHISKASVQSSPLQRQQIYNLLWAERNLQPKADIIIRSHVHEYNLVEKADWIGLTTPALQALGSKYGARRCQGLVDFGFLHFDVSEKGEVLWQKHLANLQGQSAKVLKL